MHADTDDDGAGDIGADITRRDLQAMGDALRRSGAATADALVLSVSHDGIKVLGVGVARMKRAGRWR